MYSKSVGKYTSLAGNPCHCRQVADELGLTPHIVQNLVRSCGSYDAKDIMEERAKDKKKNRKLRKYLVSHEAGREIWMTVVEQIAITKVDRVTQWLRLSRYQPGDKRIMFVGKMNSGRGEPVKNTRGSSGNEAWSRLVSPPRKKVENLRPLGTWEEKQMKRRRAERACRA